MSANKCVCCGVEIPEGRQVCPICEAEYMAVNCYTCSHHKENPFTSMGYCADAGSNFYRTATGILKAPCDKWKARKGITL